MRVRLDVAVNADFQSPEVTDSGKDAEEDFDGIMDVQAATTSLNHVAV